MAGCNKKETVEEKGKEIVKKAEKLNIKVETIVVLDDLIQCTIEEFNDNYCDDAPENKVCGYNETTKEDGTKKIHALINKNSCRYCQMFKEDGVMTLGTTTVKSLGYKEGECK